MRSGVVRISLKITNSWGQTVLDTWREVDLRELPFRNEWEDTVENILDDASQAIKETDRRLG